MNNTRRIIVNANESDCTRGGGVRAPRAHVMIMMRCETTETTTGHQSSAASYFSMQTTRRRRQANTRDFYVPNNCVRGHTGKRVCALERWHLFDDDDHKFMKSEYIVYNSCTYIWIIAGTHTHFATQQRRGDGRWNDGRPPKIFMTHIRTHIVPNSC